MRPTIITQLLSLSVTELQNLVTDYYAALQAKADQPNLCDTIAGATICRQTHKEDAWMLCEQISSAAYKKK